MKELEIIADTQEQYLYDYDNGTGWASWMNADDAIYAARRSKVKENAMAVTYQSSLAEAYNILHAPKGARDVEKAFGRVYKAYRDYHEFIFDPPKNFKSFSRQSQQHKDKYIAEYKNFLKVVEANMASH